MIFNKETDKLLLINVPPIQEVIPLNTGLGYLKAYLDLNNIQNSLINLNKEYNTNVSNKDTYLVQYDKYDEYEKHFINELEILSNLLKKYEKDFFENNIICFSIFDFECFKLYEKIFDTLTEFGWLNNKQIILGGNFFLHFDHKEKYSYLINENIDICFTLGEYYFQEVYNLPEIELYSYAQYLDENTCDLSLTPMIHFSRGCINSCVFCPHRKLNGGKLRFRNINNIISEITNIKKKHNISNFWIDTDNISNDIKRLHEFAKKLILYNKERISWKVNFSLQTKYNEEIDFKLLKRAGCDILMFGLESFSESTRKNMNKPAYSNQDIFNLAENCQKHNIKLFINIISGFITETESEFLNSLEIFKKFYEQYKDVLLYVVVNSYYIFSEDSYCGYDVEFDENGYWKYKDNTKEIRDQRLHKFIDFLNSNNINSKFTNNIETI